MGVVSKLPYFGSEKKREQIDMANKVLVKMQGMQDLFSHFINNTWIFETA